MNDEIIIVTAAGVGTWLRERFTPSGLARMFGETFMSEYNEQMEILREIDNQIFEWSRDLGLYVDMMEQAYNSHRIMDFISVVTSINLKLKEVTLKEDAVKEISEDAWKEFEKERLIENPGFFTKIKNLFHDPTSTYELTDEEIREKLHDMFGAPPAKANAAEVYEMVKNAGFLSDVKRRWVYNRLRSKKKKERDAALKVLFRKTRSVVERVRDLIKDLHKNRAAGQIGEYLDVLRKISVQQKSFEAEFKKVYNEHLKEFIQENKFQPQLPQVPSPVSTAAPPQITSDEGPEIEVIEEDEGTDEGAKPISPPLSPLPTQPAQEPVALPAPALAPAPVIGTPAVIVLQESSDIIDKIDNLLKSLNESNNNKEKKEYKLQLDNFLNDSSMTKNIENLTNILKLNPEDSLRQKIYELLGKFSDRQNTIKNLTVSSSHIHFIKKLASCSNTYEAAHQLLKYSQKIEDKDLESSLKLLAIAEGLLND